MRGAGKRRLGRTRRAGLVAAALTLSGVVGARTALPAVGAGELDPAGGERASRAGAGRERQDQDRFRLRLAVEAVNLGVAVTDKRGRFVSGLGQEDFVVRENGVPQEITFFASEVAPLHILVLLDASLSMRASLDYVKEAASIFVDRLWEGDRAMIGEFNDRVRFGGEFTDDRRRLTSTILALRPLGATALYDASILALERLHNAEDAERRALLLFTDGDDSRMTGFGSEFSAGDALEAARMTEAAIYAIGFEGNGARVNKRFLRRLTGETGGQALFPERTGDLIGSFARIEEDLHSQYRLAYVPRDAGEEGEWRTIEVSVPGRRDLTARTRTGYYTRPSSAP